MSGELVFGSGHAPLPPSAAHRWMRCPGAPIEGSPDSVYSREGTFAHEIAANCLRDGVRRAATCIGQGDGEFKVDATMAAHLQAYLDVVFGLMLCGGVLLQVEEKVRVSAKVYGTADALVWEEGRRVLHVVDLKFGAGILVFADHNEQLLIYALGALASAGMNPTMIDEVVLHIVQPRRLDAEGKAHRYATVTASELESFRRSVAAAELAKMAKNAPRIPGDHCGFCPDKATCPALRERALQIAIDVFPDADATKPVDPPPVATIPNDRLVKILAAADIVEQWIKAVRDAAEKRARAGEQLPGFKLVATIANRQWINETEAAKVLAATGVDPYAPREVVSPAQAEKLLGGKKAATFLATLTHRPVTGAKLVPESAKGVPLTPLGISQMFPLLEADDGHA